MTPQDIILNDENPKPRPTPPADADRPMTISRPAGLDLTALFMILGGGLIVGTILQQQKLDYCPNDASRWDTVYYLVEHGTYEYLPERDTWWNRKKPTSPFEVPPFWTIDLVAKKDAAGNYHYYSSKPPLLPTMAAGIVLGIEKTSALLKPILKPVAEAFTLREIPLVADYKQHPWFIMRTTLIILQAIPFMLFVWVLGRYVRERTESAFVAHFCIAVAALGTYLTPWSITFNNHVPAAFAALFALVATARIWYDGRREWYWFAAAAFFAALAATMELPAAALGVAVLLALLIRDWKRTLLFAVIPAAIPIAAGLYTNYLAMGTIRPAYSDFGVVGGLYDYPGSYWLKPTGMDALSEPKRVYLLHILIGHHGFFLLTPILAVALLGAGRHLRALGVGLAALLSVALVAFMVLVIFDVRSDGRIAAAIEQTLAPYASSFHLPRGYTLLAPAIVLLLVNIGMYLAAPARPQPMLALLVLLISAVVAGFYTIKTNNYGGGTQGARWLFWLIPLWLLLLPAGVEWVARSLLGRILCYKLLLISMITVAFAFRQPWSDSWAHILFRHLGWIRY